MSTTQPAAKSAAQTKETKMATAPDISKLSFAELQKLVDDAQGIIEHKRVEEIKVLADAYAKKITAAGFSIEEGIDALHPYMPAARTRAKRGTAAPKGPRKDVDKTGASPTPGGTYKLSTGETWTKAASGKGAPKKEFLEAVHAGKTWAELATK